MFLRCSNRSYRVFAFYLYMQSKLLKSECIFPLLLMKIEFYPSLYRIWQISYFSTSSIYITFLRPRNLLSRVKYLVLKDRGITLEVSFYSFKHFRVTRGEVTYLSKEPGWTTENWFLWQWFCDSPVPDMDTQHRSYVKTHSYQMRGKHTLSPTGKKLKPFVYFLYQNLTGLLLENQGQMHFYSIII